MQWQPKRILIAADSIALSQQVAEAIAQRIRQAKGNFALALSGGTTPAPVYTALAAMPNLDWGHVHIYWADERCVPPDSPDSNYQLVQRTLLDRISLPADHIHRVLGELPPQEAAAQYRQTLTALIPTGQHWPQFNIVLLGMGADGHTASLFPYAVSADMARLSAVTVTAHYEGRPAQRVTLTPPTLNQADSLFVLVTGVSKAAALQAILNGPVDKQRWPIQALNSQTMTYWIDQAAAQGILSALP